MALGIARVGTGQRVERGGDHELEIALGQHFVGVFEVEHFALLGDAQLAVEGVHGLGKDGAMRGSAAAAHRAAAAMEEAQLDAGLARHHVQVAMGAEDLPRAGQHAAVFVGVGVAEHDLLPVVPGGQELAIVGTAPQLAANGRRVAQVFDRFEERHRHQAGIEPGLRPILQRDAAEPRQAHHGQHIFHRCGAADDVLANGFGRAAVLDFGDDAEGFKHAGGLSGEAAGQRGRDGVGDGLLQGGGVNARVLANVERVQMQAEGAHLQDERIDERARDADAVDWRPARRAAFQDRRENPERSSRRAAPG